MLSEGVDYVIAKCMEVEPEKRYRNCKELKKDLNNIEILNTEYKRKMTGRITAFCLSLIMLASMSAVTASGYNGMQKEKNENYHAYMTEAINCKSNGDYSSAVRFYKDAIDCKGSDIDTYYWLMDSMLMEIESMQNDTDTYQKQFEDALQVIDMYITNSNSPMYNNGELMFLFVENYLTNPNVVSGRLGSKAYKYIGQIEESKEYKSGAISKDKLAGYRVMAAKLSGGNVNFKEVNEALNTLNAMSENSEAKEKLKIYQICVEMYSTYSNDLTIDSVVPYDIIDRLADQAAETLSSVIEDEGLLDMTDRMGSLYIPLCKTMITATRKSSMNNSTKNKSLAESVEYLERNLVWFDFLKKFDVKPADSLLMYKVNIYGDIFALYDNTKYFDRIDAQVLENLDKAIELLRQMEQTDNVREKINKFTERRDYYKKEAEK